MVAATFLVPAAAAQTLAASPTAASPTAVSPTAASPTAAAAVPNLGAAKKVLGAALERALGRRALRGAKVGLVVVDLVSGEVVYERAPDRLLNPASVTKVITAAVALRRLGPEFRFVTTVATVEKPEQEKLAGHLYVQGSGDPKLTTEMMYKLASNVASMGVREVTGDIVVDESYFDGQRLGAGWEQDPSDRPYQAPVGAASVNFNALEVRVLPGHKPGAPARAFTDPATSYVRIENDATTVGAGGGTKIVARSVQKGDHNVIEVSGKIALRHPGWTTWRKLDHPPLYFGTLFKEMLFRLGVKVSGKVRPGLTPPEARPLAVIRSPQLGLLISDMNKVSQNFMAEQILKTVGAQTAGKPGSWENGVRAVETLLEEWKIPRGSYTFKNGSGLNDVNRFTPRQLVTVLSRMYAHFPTAAEFVASLAVSGADGSVKRRLAAKELYRRVRVKTGWLRGVSCLAGYVGARRPLAFALFLNGVKNSGAGSRAQKDVARSLAAYGAP